MKLRDQSGQVMPVVTVMTLGLLLMVGLVIDAGLVFEKRRSLQATADAAARAGASVIDTSAYRSSGGTRAVLDPSRAATAARAYLHGMQVEEVQVSPQAVRVRLAGSQPLLLLDLLGIGPQRVEVESTARPDTGILAPGG